MSGPRSIPAWGPGANEDKRPPASKERGKGAKAALVIESGLDYPHRQPSPSWRGREAVRIAKWIMDNKVSMHSHLKAI